MIYYLQTLRTRISNLIKRAVITRPANDSKDYSIAQVKYFNKAAACEMITPYGLFTNAPIDSHVILFNFNGNEENKGGIPYLHEFRYKNLSPGEVQIGNPFHENSIKFDNDGRILINSSSDTVVTSKANYTLSATINASFSAVNISFTASNNTSITSINNSTITSTNDSTISSGNETKLKSGVFETFKSTSGGATFLPEAPNSASLSSANCFLDPSTGQIQLASSSKRFKKDIVNVEFSTSSVLRLIGKQFKKKTKEDEIDDKIYYGFIAEDSYEVFPQSVTLDREGNPLAMEIFPILMALVEEVKKNHADISYLKTQLRDN